MFINTFDLTRWNRISVGIGGVVWMLIVLARLSGWIMLDDLVLILLLALCVITPLAVPLVTLPKKPRLSSGLSGLAIFLQPFVALVGGASLLLDRGPLAAAAASVWFLFTALIALIGVLLLLQKNGRSLPNTCLAVALVYVPIGSAWFVLDRLGLQPLGFSQTTVLLTAVHFHFITLATLVITGLTGRAILATRRKVPWKIYRVAALCMLLNPLLVATGITMTQITGLRFLEAAAADLLALSMILIALLNLCCVVPTTAPSLAKGLLAFSSTAVAITMVFAGAYALGNATGLWAITIAQMIVVHGWVNALVFGLCGLLGWRLRVELETVTPQRKIAPGPRGSLFFGSVLEMKRDPIGFITELAHDYGDIAHMRLLSLPAFVVSHPDYAKHILLDNHQNYGRNSVTHKTIRSVVGYGLATNDGESWLHQRRLMQPTFHHKRILSFGKQMTEATMAMLERWQHVAGQDQPLDILEQMHRLTLHIVGQTLFNIDLSDEANPTGQAFKTVFRLMMDYFYLPFPPLSVPTPRNLRLKAALRTLDEVVYGIIFARRGQHEGPVDLLSMLLEAQDEETGERMNDRQVRDEIMTVLLAGQETSATTLTWTCYLLSQHPDAEQRLSAELESVLGGRPPTVEDLDKLPYTQMLIKETMRLYPAAWSIPRHAIHEDEIGSYYIPANSLMWISLYTTHRHPGFWEDPEVFDPERFTPEREASRPRFAYFPFGGGPHLCIGNSFAMMETQLLIAAIAQRYRLRMAPGHEVKPIAVPTLQPVNGLPMTLHER